MRSDLHLDPDGLDAAGALLDRIVDRLASIPRAADLTDAVARLPGGAVLAAEHERLVGTVTCVVAELVVMRAAVGGAAAGGRAADDEIAARLRAAVDG